MHNPFLVLGITALLVGGWLAGFAHSELTYVSGMGVVLLGISLTIVGVSCMRDSKL